MSRHDFIFSDRTTYRLARHIVFWLGFYLFSFVTYFHDFYMELGLLRWLSLEAAESFLHILAQVIFCYTVMYLIIPKLYNASQYFKFYVVLFIASAAMYIFYYLMSMYLFKAIHSYFGLRFRPPTVLAWFTFISFVSYFPASTGLALAIKTIKSYAVKHKENEQLIRENANAELQLLKAQIHPHFLFNTLNNIYSFALDQSPYASLLIEKLSATLSYMINDCQTSLVTLDKEIRMIFDYLELEKIRYGSRLNLRMQINNNCVDCLIAPLLMIPFVENCFKHGTSLTLEKPWIDLTISCNENILAFDLNNSKPSEPQKIEKRNKIGLENVKKRLELIYPQRHRFLVTSTNNSLRVTLSITLDKSNAILSDPASTLKHQELIH